MIDHHDWLDVAVAAFTFGNTIAGALIGGVIARRQSRNADRQAAMHVENRASLAEVKDAIAEAHAPGNMSVRGKQ
jgi:Na+/glutamate symporter